MGVFGIVIVGFLMVCIGFGILVWFYIFISV
nr:MAG TPA: SCIMP protein [Caudoviricetes sp.]